MSLSSMVISRDAEQISILECILGGLHIAVDVEAETDRARTKLAKSRVDALIVDADLEGSLNFLQEMSGKNNQNSVPLVIVGPRHKRKSSQAQPASFMFQKPISVEQAVHVLSCARNMIVERRLHYHRQRVKVVASVTVEGRKFKAQFLNLSQGGACFCGAFTPDFVEPLHLEFTLPGTSSPISIMANVAWADEKGFTGVQFIDMSSALRRSLQLWLEQRYFAP